ncbi:MAG: DEAD/DEAH box helicase [Rhodospirillaceae bacterium]|nr:DEAD/DEAH box helicase [Rhodospirillaceae bacterium]
MTEFEGVVPALSQALNKRGYTVLTPVQEAVLDTGLADADLLVSAQTGSGKTVAFGMAFAPTLLAGEERFSRVQSPLALVIAPTRELALQVQRELEWLYAATGASVASCVGGMDMRTERRALSRGAHIVVGTPGRLRDHVERGSLDLSAIKAVVLDEADEMLDMGFREELEAILNAAAPDRRTLMFSATVPKSITTLAKRYQRDAVRISTTSEKEQHHDIEYCAYTAAAKDKENAIINVLRFYDAKTAIVFCATRATVNRVTSRFNNRGFSVVALSGELSQSQRTHALQALRDGRARVCIATDVAARGIDLPNLELVIHADLPKNREGLLHRSGRTGRAGRKGTSVLIVPHNARKRTERMLQGAKIDASWSNPPTVHEIMARDDERILADPVLTEPVKEDEQEFAAQIMGRHSPEQVAAALVRLYRAGQSAPEELLDKAPADDWDDRGGRKREGRDSSKDAFKKGVWFSLSVGRKHTAEARWLLPALIKGGDIQKSDIGAIRIQESETYFEISPESADKFMEALGPSRKLEKSMSVDRLGDMPAILKEGGADEQPAEPRREPRRESRQESRNEYVREKPRGKKKRFDGDKSKSKPGPKRKYGEKPGQVAADEQALKQLMADTEAEVQNNEPKEDLRSHPNKPAADDFGGKKSKKSKKSKKNKGKRSAKPDVAIESDDFQESERGPKLKIGKAGNKDRKRVTRKGGKPDTSGSAPLRRKRD